MHLPFPPIFLQKGDHLPHQFGQVENSHGQSFKRRAYSFILKVIWYPLSLQAECLWLHYNTMRMVNITLMCKRCDKCYMINVCCLIIFILCKEKNRSLVYISGKQKNFMAFNHNFSVNKLTKKLLTGKLNC